MSQIIYSRTTYLAGGVEEKRGTFIQYPCAYQDSPSFRWDLNDFKANSWLMPAVLGSLDSYHKLDGC